MSYAVWRVLRTYAQWREAYLEENPDKRLFSWLGGGIKAIPKPEEPIITIGEKGKKIQVLAIVALGLVLLASKSRDS